MRQVKALAWAGLFGGMVTLALGYALALPGLSSWLLSLPVLFLAGFWWLGEHYRADWIHTAVLGVYTALAAAGSWLGVWIGWSILGLAGMLIAWDLSYFAARLHAVEEVDDGEVLVRRHLSRLGAVVLLALLLAGAAILLQIRFSFGLALALSLLAVAGVIQGMRYFKRLAG